MVVDASVWVACYIPSDVFHLRSARWVELQASQGRRLLAPQLVLPETAGPVARVTGRPEIGMAASRDLNLNRNLGILPMDTELIAEAAELAAFLRLRGADAVYVATARRHSVPLVTWDTQMRSRAGAVIQVIEPV
jgi:predicted nucleic acid-binding protein